MFLEVNSLKGLIINVGSEATFSDQWLEISNIIRCAFIYKDKEQKEVIQSKVSQSSIFVEKIVNFFAPNASINNAMMALGLQPYEVAYVTHTSMGLENVLTEPIGTILVSPVYEIKYDKMGHIPDFIVSNVSTIKSIITREHKGFFGELFNTRTDRNGVSFLSDSGYIIKTKLHCGTGDRTVYAAGRYFQPGHIKFPLHQLSHRIKKSKNDKSQNEIFAETLSRLLGYVNKNILLVDGVTRVPPQPGEQDRLLPILISACNKSHIHNLSSYLICIEKYPKQKTLLRDARIENVRGKFQVSNNVKGKHIVLFDDVLTTGSTVSECADQLILAGAAEVTIIVLGINQFKPLWESTRKSLLCSTPGCSGNMIMKLNNDGKGAFYGCTNYRQFSCRGLNFMDGWKASNLQNHSELLETNDDEDFFPF